MGSYKHNSYSEERVKIATLDHFYTSKVRRIWEKPELNEAFQTHIFGTFGPFL